MHKELRQAIMKIDGHLNTDYIHLTYRKCQTTVFEKQTLVGAAYRSIKQCSESNFDFIELVDVVLTFVHVMVHVTIYMYR